ncbi:MAG: helix-hairpin-helix domain-containing protein [Spirochaetes bacterium]|nr:helix-hairpin-helix domain-containing protein [Spirochaetota bacterium]
MNTLFVILMVFQNPPAAFEYRASSPAALFPFVRAVSDSALVNTGNPAYIPLWNSFHFGASYARPYALEGLNTGTSHAGYSDGTNGIQGSYSLFGTGEYRERGFALDAGRLVHPRITAGVGVARHDLSIEADGYSRRHSLIDFTAAAIIMPFEWLHLGFIQENIRSALDDSDGLMYPSWSTGVAVIPARGVSIAWNLNREYYGPINSFSLSANLLPRVGVRAGYARETSSFSGAVLFSLGRLIVSYGIRQHAYLGATHSVAITALSVDSFFEEIRYETLRRRRNFTPPARKIDINKCELEDLAEIPVLREGIPERIMKYRQMIGPVSRHALRQIGLEELEVNELMEHIEGLAEESDRNEKYRRPPGTGRGAAASRPYASNEKRKELFTGLIHRGVPASVALRVADRARDLGRDELIREIAGMKDIPDHIKKAIISACSEPR